MFTHPMRVSACSGHLAASVARLSTWEEGLVYEDYYTTGGGLCMVWLMFNIRSTSGNETIRGCGLGTRLAGPHEGGGVPQTVLDLPSGYSQQLLVHCHSAASSLPSWTQTTLKWSCACVCSDYLSDQWRERKTVPGAGAAAAGGQEEGRRRGHGTRTTTCTTSTFPTANSLRRKLVSY